MVDSQLRVRRLMSCLGDPSRFELVRRLLKGERCVSDLAQDIGLSQSCTTRHLQVLQREQMVLGERDGKRVMFRLCMDEPQVSALLSWAMSARAGARAANPGRGVPKPRTPSSPAPARVAPSRAPAREPAAQAAPAPGSGRGTAPETRPGPGLETNPDRTADSEPPPRRPLRHEIEDYLL